MIANCKPCCLIFRNLLKGGYDCLPWHGRRKNKNKIALKGFPRLWKQEIPYLKKTPTHETKSPEFWDNKINGYKENQTCTHKISLNATLERFQMKVLQMSLFIEIAFMKAVSYIGIMTLSVLIPAGLSGLVDQCVLHSLNLLLSCIISIAEVPLCLILT